jgi:hypothetical protein
MRKGIRRKMLAIGTLLMLVLGMATVVQADGNPVSFSAIVHKSDGSQVDSQYDGTKATVIAIDLNTGEETKYDTVLQNGHIAVSIPGDVISNSKIRIKIDGSAWNDADYYVHALDDPSSIDIVTFESDVQGSTGTYPVQTYKDIPMNLKPIIALVFIILILLFGFLFFVWLHRQKVNIVVSGKERDKVQTKQGFVEKWKYTCSYGTEEDLKEIGTFHDDKDFEESSLLKISVRKVMKKPDGSYEWYDPRPVDMSKLSKDQMPSEPDTEEMVDKKWFQGGSVTPNKGQSLKSASQRYTHRLFTAFVYPFLVLELIFGVGSFWYEPFQFPPSITVLIINILILVFAMIFMIGWYSKSTKEDKPTEKPPVAAAAAPATFEEMKPVKAEEEIKEAPKEEVAEVLKEEVKEEAAPAETAPAAAPAATAEEKIPCPNCGQELGADFVVCPFCGESIK